MIAVYLLDVAGAMVAVWGTAHVVPTARLVRGFSPITAENRRILEELTRAFIDTGLG